MMIHENSAAKEKISDDAMSQPPAESLKVDCSSSTEQVAACTPHSLRKVDKAVYRKQLQQQMEQDSIRKRLQIEEERNVHQIRTMDRDTLTTIIRISKATCSTTQSQDPDQNKKLVYHEQLLKQMQEDAERKRLSNLQDSPMQEFATIIGSQSATEVRKYQNSADDETLSSN